MKSHNRTHFYKYLSIDGLENITKNLTMRYASPLTFNDPFDSQFEVGFDFKFEDAADALLNKMEEFVFGDNEPKGNTENPLFNQLAITRRNRSRHNIRSFREHFKMTKDRMIQTVLEAKPQLDQIWKSVFNTIRIFCLTEDHKNLLMWSHYADQHRGAVLRIGCIRELDSVLLSATPVKYTNNAPVIATMDDWVNNAIGLSEINYDQHLMKLVTTKSKDWEYEKEWRVVNFVTSTDVDDGNYLYSTFHPEEIQAIYFGCRVDRTKIEKIKDEMDSKLSHVECYKGRRMKWKFELVFEEMN